MRHRPAHPTEIEPRFRRDVVIRVDHRLPAEQSAVLEEALALARASHQSVHEATASISESIAFQTGAGRAVARQQLSQVIANAAQARAALEE